MASAISLNFQDGKAGEKRPEIQCSSFLCSAPSVLCGDEGMDFSGTRYVPDTTKGYFDFHISHGLVVTAYGTTIEPGTIRNSFSSMKHQVINLMHEMKAYHPERENMKGDRVVGTVLDVSLVNGADGTNHIHGIGVLHKLAYGLNHVVGQHQTGRHEWTVSMEVNYWLDESGFLMGREGDSLEATMKAIKDEEKERCLAGTPDHLRRRGRLYLPWANAPEDLRQCFSSEQGRIVSKWRDLDTVLMMGGVGGKVHYHGVGVVTYGAEPTARIGQLLATHPVHGALEGVSASVRQLVTEIGKKTA